MLAIVMKATHPDARPPGLWEPVSPSEPRMSDMANCMLDCWLYSPFALMICPWAGILRFAAFGSLGMWIMIGRRWMAVCKPALTSSANSHQSPGLWPAPVTGILLFLPFYNDQGYGDLRSFRCSRSTVHGAEY